MINAEAVARICSVKQVFLENSQNSQRNTCARVSFLIKLQASGVSYEFCEIFKNTFFYGTPPVGASALIIFKRKFLYDSCDECKTANKKIRR